LDTSRVEAGGAVSVAEFDAMPEAQAAELLKSCCGSARWVAEMLTRRPFASRDTFLEAADSVWLALTPADWLEAFSHHPRIGARDAHGPAAEEQAGVSVASDGTRAGLGEVNRLYEERFGYIYIVCAAGKSGAEMLEIARGRLGNPPDLELAIAAGEQQKITRLRLEKVIR
jgi:2-oxo-4-hydroxy-4-carboxy-5-ureidoimidazoline decarboxylase